MGGGPLAQAKGELYPAIVQPWESKFVKLSLKLDNWRVHPVGLVIKTIDKDLINNQDL